MSLPPSSSGADAGINYRTQDLTAEARRITGGTGANVVLDNIGDPQTFPRRSPRSAFKGDWSPRAAMAAAMYRST